MAWLYLAYLSCLDGPLYLRDAVTANVGVQSLGSVFRVMPEDLLTLLTYLFSGAGDRTRCLMPAVH